MTRPLRLWPLGLLLCSLSLVGACAGGGPATTAATAPAPTVTTATSTSSTGPGSGSVGTAAPTIHDPAYISKMQKWMTDYLFGIDTSALTIDDPANASAAQLDAADQFAQKVRAAVEELRAITPPPAVSALHSEFVASIVQLSQAIENYVEAMKSRDQSKMKIAIVTFGTARSRVEAATDQLAPMLGIEVPLPPGD